MDTVLVTASDWVALSSAVVAAVAIIVSWLATRFNVKVQQQLSQHALSEQRLTSQAAITAQSDLAANERVWAQRAAVYVALLEWADAVRAKKHIDPEERQRVARIPPDVVARAKAFASQEVLEQLEAMTSLRDRDAKSFQTQDEVVASARRSWRLLPMAEELRDTIRQELGTGR